MSILGVAKTVFMLIFGALLGGFLALIAVLSILGVIAILIEKFEDYKWRRRKDV